MKLLLCAVAVVAMVVLSGGCTYAVGPVAGAITVDVKGPVAAGDAKTGTKVGTSKAQGVILVAFGDASISAAAKEAGIQRIHHVDCETLSVLGIYSRYETIVYGE